MSCSKTECEHQAVMAVRTTATDTQGLKTMVYWDASEAPKTAEQLCAPHGRELLSGLATTLAWEPSALTE